MGQVQMAWSKHRVDDGRLSLSLGGRLVPGEPPGRSCPAHGGLAVQMFGGTRRPFLA